MRRAFVACALCCACGGVATSSVDDAGDDTDFTPLHDSGPTALRDAGVGRVTPHENVIVAAPEVLVVYIGKQGVDSAPPQDGFIDWVLGSKYWGLLEQYGVGSGKRVASIQVARESLVPNSDLDANGLTSATTLESRVFAWIADTGSHGANTFVFFLPDGVDVKLAIRGNYTYRTCIDAYGYHAFDGREPYVIMPPCPKGRETDAISHELAELATNPKTFHGWFSNDDLPKGGGEIGDLCMSRVTQVEGWSVAQLWSNRDQQCMP